MPLWLDLVNFYDKFHNTENYWLSFRDGSGFPPFFHNILGFKTPVVCVTVNEGGEFVSARWVRRGEGDEPIFYPVSVKSASRRSMEYTHPLCDKIQSFGDPAYLENLDKWLSYAKHNSVSAYGNLNSIRKYVAKTTVSEMVKVLKSYGIQGVSEKTFVIWSVLLNGESVDCWKEDALIDSYIRYNDSTLKTMSECMITGEPDHIPRTYPPTLVRWGAAKLFSCNRAKSVRVDAHDDINQDNLLFIGAHTAEKITSTLRLLEQNSTFFCGQYAIMCWSPEGQVSQSTQAMLFGGSNREEAGAWKTELEATLTNSFGKKKLTAADPVCLLILKHPESERIVVKEYEQFAFGKLQENMNRWDEACKATYPYSTSNKNCQYPADRKAVSLHRGKTTPSVFSLAKYSTGHCVKGSIAAPTAELSRQYVRILLDRLKGNRIKDISGFLCLFAMRHTVSEEENRKIIYCTEAAVRKQTSDGGSIMENQNDTSYQYGRLLAVFEQAEMEYNRRKNISRPPMTRRQTQSYRINPLRTTEMFLERSRQFVLCNIPNGEYYHGLIQEILATISKLPPVSRLEPSYVLGFAAQIEEMSQKEDINDGENK